MRNCESNQNQTTNQIIYQAGLKCNMVAVAVYWFDQLPRKTQWGSQKCSKWENL